MPPGTEFSSFAASLEPFCASEAITFYRLGLEEFLDHQFRLALPHRLHLCLASEALVCGHLMPTAEGAPLFVPVRTPFAASSSLRFVTLRTWSLILLYPNLPASANAVHGHRLPAAAGWDPWDFLARAIATLAAVPPEDRLFLQPQSTEPIRSPHQNLSALRATFITGTPVAAVLPEPKDPPIPLVFHLL